MKKVIKTYQPKMSAVCSTDNLRIAMNHVYVSSEHVVATNGHIIVVHETKSLFPDLAIEKPFLIHKKTWKDLERGYYSIELSGDVISIKDGFCERLIRVVSDEYPTKYPNYKAIIPQSDTKFDSIDKIGINPSLLGLAYKAMFRPDEYYLVKVTFFGDTDDFKKLHLKAISGCIAVVMPCHLSDFE